MRPITFIIFIFVLAFTACGAQNRAYLADHEGSPKLETTSELKARINKLMHDIDYIPKLNKSDGCYARALLISAELELMGVESGAQYVSIPGRRNLRPEPGLRWQYHVAPIVWFLEEDEPQILDILMEDHMITRQEWLRRVHSNPKDDIQLQFSYAEDFAAIQGREIQFGPYTAPQLASVVYVEHSYRKSDLLYSCNYLKSMVNDVREIKLQDKLIAATHRLIEGLHKIGKIDQGSDYSLEDFRCY